MEGDLHAIIFNSIDLIIPKWQMLKFLRWMQNFHHSAWDHAILYGDKSSEDDFVKNQNYKYGRQLKFKIHILFYGESLWTLALRQMKFRAMKDRGHT
jgi:hypothetical protein